MPAVTKKYLPESKNLPEIKEGKKMKSCYVDKDSQEVHLSWTLKEAKDFDRWVWMEWEGDQLRQ